jgi:hypothetical protein
MVCRLFGCIKQRNATMDRTLVDLVRIDTCEYNASRFVSATLPIDNVSQLEHHFVFCRDLNHS